MGHFRSDLRDLEFDLFEVFRVQDEPATTDVDTDRTRCAASSASSTRWPPGPSPRASPRPTATRRRSTRGARGDRAHAVKRAQLLTDGEW